MDVEGRAGDEQDPGAGPRSGDGWRMVEGLGAPDSRDPHSETGKPEVRVLTRGDGVTVVSLTFRAGDVMADHRAAAPILVVAERGTIDFGVGGQMIALAPGQAINVAARVPHRLEARQDAAATLLVLTGAPAPEPPAPEPVAFVGRLPWVIPERG
ncbi:MAG: cupin domain-containing protein [Propioniciclava sp.]